MPRYSQADIERVRREMAEEEAERRRKIDQLRRDLAAETDPTKLRERQREEREATHRRIVKGYAANEKARAKKGGRK